MGNKFLTGVSLAAVVLLTIVVAGANDRRDRLPDVLGYNVLAERMYKGIVASEGTTSEGLMYFPLRTAATTMEVQIGPKEFVEHNRFKLQTGEMVTVIGMPIVMKDRHVVLAREVRTTSRVLIVRDPLGLPLWEGNRPILMDPERWVRFYDQCELIW
jgi:hypothetical protein